jgi:hypothetical protein
LPAGAPQAAVAPRAIAVCKKVRRLILGIKYQASMFLVGATTPRVPHPPGFPVRPGGVNQLHAAFLRVVHRSCRSAGETGHFLSSAGSATNPRVPHPSRFLRRVGYHESRYRRSRIPPLNPKNGFKDGAPVLSLLPAVPNTTS